MEVDSLVLLDNGSNLLDGLDGSNLVVDHHDLMPGGIVSARCEILPRNRRRGWAATHRDEAGVGADGRLEELKVDESVGLDGEVGDVEALVLQDSARVEDALVLGLSGDAELKEDRS